ncbi:MAG: hypothetical protein HC876_16880 [Chloroflexaceae bacterium]|nr:hypothetical protein [Chloroflexaceae bacterium]NJO07053.1 hypothetical protein [Chloroflexaceae bacterium]
MTTEEPEQIGPFVFASNPEYPYPFKVAKPPRFWLDEQTGKLAEVVEIYFRTEPLTTEQMDWLKLYVHQYLERAVIASDANRNQLLSRIAKLRTVNDLEQFVEELAEWGVEPF